MKKKVLYLHKNLTAFGNCEVEREFYRSLTFFIKDILGGAHVI